MKLSQLCCSFSLALAIIGCDSGSSNSDATAGTDATVTRDATVVVDSGLSADTGIEAVDTGVAPADTISRQTATHDPECRPHDHVVKQRLQDGDTHVGYPERLAADQTRRIGRQPRPLDRSVRNPQWPGAHAGQR